MLEVCARRARDASVSEEALLTFIDWSDAEGMVDLFREFVRDEWNGSPADPDRWRFLQQLLAEVGCLRAVELVDAIQRLRALRDSIPDEFSADPVSVHLSDLIHELEGLA